ncbi:MAG: 4a-hydroxytetrahydrobiopterin dehydratase [Solirubrobacterales bacterium]|nr:4a-hydroxytetrahydrobiopterin dehydratase [Solirubrobacterales bacterium]
MALLDDKQIQDNLAELDGWKLEGRMIVRVFEFEDFVGSINFVDSLVAPAEEMNHHPDLAISWNKVTVAVTNHAEGGLTEKDFELARRIQKPA